MKQSLQLRVGQQLTMTPQLQQAIRLLQLSSLELQAEIQQALENNIMLEVADGELETENAENSSEESLLKEEKETTEFEEETGIIEKTAEKELESAEIPEEFPIDSSWEEIYDSTLSYQESSSSEVDNREMMNNQSGDADGLRDYLKWQLDLTPFTLKDKAIASVIIDAIDEDGYLRLSLGEICQSLGKEDKEKLPSEKEIAIVLQRVQHFDPLGVAARDLSECLLIQLKQKPPETPGLEVAKQLAESYLSLLGNRDYNQLMRRLKISREELQQVINLIQSLNPRPGNKLENNSATYIVPDVFVKKINGKWLVELNTEVSPRLRVNMQYASLISKIQSKADNESLKNHLQEARWFIKSLKSRHETLLKVTRCIMERQITFLEYGAEAMKPLVLHDVAAELEMHESTISRVTTQKYVHTSRGIFELKYFFSSHVSTDSGGQCSSTAIRALIKKLIDAENAAKPLSDSKIASLLSDQGIKVARRTVAKYREAMLIPPSNERKSLV